MNNEFFIRILSSLIIIPITFFIIIKGSLLFNFFIIICFFISCYEWYLMSKKNNYFIPGIFFLIISFYSVFSLRNGYIDLTTTFYAVLIICISTDIGGYVFGKLFKGPKLTKVSPNKTYSGMVGAYLLSITTIYIFINNPINLNIFNIQIDKGMEFNKEILLFTIIMSTTSQLGDLIVSFFKRISNLKNTGKLIPGHGGLLDRIDGMIFAFPLSYLIIYF